MTDTLRRSSWPAARRYGTPRSRFGLQAELGVTRNCGSDQINPAEWQPASSQCARALRDKTTLHQHTAIEQMWKMTGIPVPINEQRVLFTQLCF